MTQMHLFNVGPAEASQPLDLAHPTLLPALVPGSAGRAFEVYRSRRKRAMTGASSSLRKGYLSGGGRRQALDWADLWLEVDRG